MKCQKCDDGTRYEFVTPVRLLGGYSTHLCTACSNAFHEHAKALPEWQEMELLQDRAQDIALSLISRGAATKDLDPIRRRLREIEDAFYEIGKAWASVPR